MKNQNIQREKVSGEAGNTNDRTCALEQPNVVEDRFRVLIEKNLDGILLLDEQTTFIYVSPSIQTISGYEPAELLYKQGLDYVHPDDKAPVSASLSTLLKNPEGTVTSRFRFLKKDGQWQWVEAQVMNLLHEPSVKALVANFRDISETIKREENFQSAQELLHSLMEYVVTPILVTSIDGTVRTASEAWKRLFNLEHEEVRGKNLQHLVPLNAAEDALASNKEIAETKKVLSYDRSVVTPAGRKFLNIVKFPLLDKQGSVEAVGSMAIDVTKLRKTEELLHSSQKRWRSMFTAANDSILLLDSKMNVIVCNRCACDMFGYSEEEMLQHNLWDFREHSEQDKLSAQIQEVIHTGNGRWSTFDVRKDGTVFPAEASVTLMLVEGERQYLYIVRDITERKNFEESLRRSEELYRSIIAASPDDIVITDLKGDILLTSPNGLKMFGYGTEDEVRGKNLLEFIILTDRDIAVENLRKLMEGTRIGPGEYTAVRRDGTRFPVEVNGEILRDQNNKPSGFVFIVRDATERKRTHEELLKLRKAVETSEDIIFITDIEGTFTFVNPAFMKLYGYSEDEIIGKATPRILKSGKQEHSFYSNFWDSLLKKTPVKTELTNKTKNGELVSVEVSANPIFADDGTIVGFLALQRDITQRKALEQQVLRTQRLESLGTLASGIAHDLNNILSPIWMGTEILRHRLTEPETQKILETVASSAQRGSEIVKQVVTFARGMGGKFGPVQIRLVLDDLVKLMRETFPRSIDIQTEFEPNLRMVQGDITQLHQVFLNLCLNSRDAMPLHGTLTLTAKNFEMDESIAQSIMNATAGTYVLVSVKDTGTGISESIIDKIFDPFYTTKEVGKGTGLGLSTTHSLVKNHKGFITVHSEFGKGTEFKVYFPVSLSTEKEQSFTRTALPQGRGELILVVDDERSIRDLTQQTLALYNYTTLTAADGAEGVAQFSKMSGAIKLMLVDLMMPVMDGAGLIRAIRKIDKEVKIVAMSGLTTELSSVDMLGGNVQAFLQKPYTIEHLLRTVSNVLH